MSLQRLWGRATRLEARWRPAHVAAVLARVRQCAPGDLQGLQAYLLAELTAVDRVTCEAIMDQLTHTELEALIGPADGE